MSDYNTQDGAEPSPASAGSVAHRLAESLRDMSDTLNACGNDFGDILLDAARELDSRRWIPVTERLPGEDQLVLVFDPEIADFGLATHTKSDGWLGECVALYEPTHWMPLPAPPEMSK